MAVAFQDTFIGKHAHEDEKSQLFTFISPTVGPLTGRTRVSLGVVAIRGDLAHRNEAARSHAQFSYRMFRAFRDASRRAVSRPFCRYRGRGDDPRVGVV